MKQRQAGKIKVYREEETLDDSRKLNAQPGRYCIYVCASVCPRVGPPTLIDRRLRSMPPEQGHVHDGVHERGISAHDSVEGSYQKNPHE
jgi:hypothetical protein